MRKNIQFGVLLVLLVFGLFSVAFVKDNNKFFEISKNIEIFANVYREVNTYYVDEIEPSQLMRVGIDAMVESLDPYTNYISESQIEGYRFITEGRYNGIGASSETIKDLITITELYEGQPADKAGLKVGDRILAIDGKVTKGKTEEDINNILRGFHTLVFHHRCASSKRLGIFSVTCGSPLVMVSFSSAVVQVCPKGLAMAS